MNLINDSYISFVNLDSRADRLNRMKESIKATGLKVYRTPGILPDAYLNDPKYQVMKNRTPGAIGCHLAQESIIRKAFALKKHAFVMEDDLIFCSDFKKRLIYIDNWAKTHYWDIIWLGGTFHVNPPIWHKDTLGRDAEVTDDPRMIRTYGSFCTYAYIINKNSIKNILNLFSQWIKISIGIDWLMIQISPQLKTFAFVPGCIKQYDNKSNIGSGMTSFSLFSTLNGTIANSAYWYQDKMNDFNPATFNWAEANMKK